MPMTANELSKNASVEVTRGPWKGTRGFIEDITDESSVVRIRDWQGYAAYALKEDVVRIDSPKLGK